MENLEISAVFIKQHWSAAQFCLHPCASSKAVFNFKL